MPRPLDVFAAALQALEAGKGVAVAAVINARGSTPRHLGARMVVTADGAQWDTVGGGKIEQLVVEAAQQVAGGAAARVVRQHLIRDLAMCCGGVMEVAITPGEASRAALELLAGSRAPRVLETPLDGSPLRVREPRHDDPPMHAPKVIGDALVERVGDHERVIVFGLGHVARVLGPMLQTLGFRVIACDDGDTGALDASPAWADQVIESFDVAEVERRVGGFGSDDYVLVITRDHAIDQRLLEALIARDELGYLGMIGSRGKVGRFKKRLEHKGLLADEQGHARWARLRAPVGLDLGAETPAEIAISIAAELVARRRRGASTAGDWAVKKASDV
ncbi:MAG TPA: xanthine dehydrogenase accessory protein XdhC [Kofleriaceae bacterium]